MGDTLSTPDPATQVAEVRDIIRNRGSHTCEATLLAIRRVVNPPAEAGPVERDDRNWPIIPPAGTAWERHDEPDSQL